MLFVGSSIVLAPLEPRRGWLRGLVGGRSIEHAPTLRHEDQRRGLHGCVKRRLLAVPAIAVLALTGCSKDPIAGVDRSIYLVGDSVMASAEWGNGTWDDPAPDGYKTRTEAFGGKTAADHLEEVRRYASENVPERLVVELGTNEARAGGWGPSDDDTYRALIAAAPARSCVVVVVPAAAPWASATDRTNLEAAAAEIRQIADTRPNRRVLEFSTFIDAHPGLVAADGIHLVDDPDEPGTATAEARDAYRDWLWPSVVDCAGERRAD